MGPFTTNATDSSSGSPGIRELRSPTRLPSPADEVFVPRIYRALQLGPRMFGMENERVGIRHQGCLFYTHGHVIAHSVTLHRVPARQRKAYFWVLVLIAAAPPRLE